MSKLSGAREGALFLPPNTELTSPKQESQRRKRACGLVDGIVGGERVLIHKPSREMSEKAIEIQIRAALAGAGIWVRKHNVDKRSPFGSGLGIGVADLICIVKGRFLGIEVKRPSTRNDLSDDQKRWAKTVLAAGAMCGVATCIEEAFALVDAARALP
jgi:hypothetical protein